MSRELPASLTGDKLGHTAVRQACADAGLPLRDRYGYGIPDAWVVRAVKAARTGRTLTAGVDALTLEVYCEGLELSPAAYDSPVTEGEAFRLVRILRSPVADGVVR